MKPSCLGAERTRAPAAWVAASAWPNRPAASAEALPGSTQRRMRQLLVDGEHLGHRDPAVAGLAPASAARAPRRRRSRRAGGRAVFMIAVVPSESRSLVAVDGVAAGDRRGRDHRGAEQLLGVLGDDGLAGHVRARPAGPRSRVGSCWSAETSAAQVRSTIASTSSNPRPHRSTGPAPRRRFRPGRSRGTAGPGPGSADPPGCDAATSARLPSSIASTRSLSVQPARRRTAGPGAPLGS